MLTPGQFRRGWSRAKSGRSTWEGTWQDICDYMMPDRRQVFIQATGQRQDQLLFDSTAQNSHEDFKSQLQDGLIPDWMQWAELKPGLAVQDPTLRDEARGRLREINDLFFEKLQSSNFDEQVGSSLNDMTIGFGCIRMDYLPDDSFDFEEIAFNYVWLKTERGRTTEFYTQTVVSEETARRVWPGIQLRPGARGTSAGGSETGNGQDKAYQNTGTVAPGEIRLIVGLIRDKAAVVETWDYCVIEEGASSDGYAWHRTIVGEARNPYIPYQWSRLPGEHYGRGPGWRALGPAKSLNTSVEIQLENSEMQAGGIWEMDDDGTANVESVEIVPGTVIPRDPTSTAGLRAVTPPGNIGSLDPTNARLEYQISRAFYTNPLGPPEGTPMSATEAGGRLRLDARAIAPNIIMLIRNLLFPVQRFGLYNMRRSGEIVMPNLDGRVVSPVVVSPLARAAENQELQEITGYMQQGNALVGQEVMKTLVKDDELARHMAELWRFRSRFLRTPDEMTALAVDMGNAVAAGAAQGADVAAAVESIGAA